MKFHFLLSILVFMTIAAAKAQIVSDFSTGSDSWQTSGQGGIVTWKPAGFITATDWNIPVGAGTIPAYWNFNAPAKFLGNISSYYNGNLTFDLQETIARAAVQQADVQLTSGTTTLYYFSISPTYPATAPGWTSYTVPLSEATGNWKTANSATATAATNADIKFVLANMIGLYIRGRYGLAPLTTGSIDNVSLTPFLITTQPSPQAVCDGVTAVLNTAATGNSATTYLWQKFNTAFGSWDNLTNVAPYSGAFTSSLNINTTGNKGAGSYRCQIAGAGATNMWTNPANVTVNPNPNAPTTTGKSGCVPSSLALTAAGGAAGQYRWYTNASGGTAIAGQTAAIYTTGSLSITTTYYVSINNGTCESARVPVTATLVPVLAAPVTTGASACAPGTLILSATGGSAGQYRWYTVASGGTAAVGQTNNTFSTGFISVSTTYYAALDNGSCESARTAVTAQIFTTPALPGTAGGSSCGTGAVTLNANGGGAGQYRWYTTSSGGTASTQTNAAFVTPSITTTTTYYVSLNNGSCEGARAAIVATINTPPPVPTIVSVQGRCTPGAVIVTVGGAAAGQYRWYTVSTGGTAIAGETNNVYVTPSISASTSYYVSINNGVCESGRLTVVATIFTPAPPPPTTGATACAPGTLVLKAGGSINGFYRWYNVASGGSPFNGEVNNQFTTPFLTVTTTFYVSINDGNCEGNRSPVVAEIKTCDLPPSISAATTSTEIDGEVTLSLLPLLSDPEDNIDLTSLKIVTPPASKAAAKISANYLLSVDYKGLKFSGADSLTIEVCDDSKLCTQQQIRIEVVGDVVIYNGVSANGDARNDVFFIKNIDALETTKNNHVSIYNRWGDIVFEMDNYDNGIKSFSGLNKDGAELPAGTYFYKIDFSGSKKTKTGYISLKR